jgi:hypothetical protein
MAAVLEDEKLLGFPVARRSIDNDTGEGMNICGRKRS